MRHVKFWIGLMAPLVLGTSPALAQQVVPQQSPDPGGTDETNQTRKLEREIEDYPGPNDGMRDQAEDTRIPEEKAPKQSPSPRPQAASPARPSSSPSSAIDPSEVERVM